MSCLQKLTSGKVSQVNMQKPFKLKKQSNAVIHIHIPFLKIALGQSLCFFYYSSSLKTCNEIRACFLSALCYANYIIISFILLRIGIHYFYVTNL